MRALQFFCIQNIFVVLFSHVESMLHAHVTFKQHNRLFTIKLNLDNMRTFDPVVECCSHISFQCFIDSDRLIVCYDQFEHITLQHPTTKV